MKKILFSLFTLTVIFSLGACSSQHHASTKVKPKIEQTTKKKAIKHHTKKIHHKKQISNKVKANYKEQSSSLNNNVQNQVNQNKQAQPLTQGQINMQRGCDPNGSPLLPGQDHAAGSNPDGSPDDWVQGQINWEKRNGYLNQDGTLTEKGRQANKEVHDNEYVVDDDDNSDY